MSNHTTTTDTNPRLWAWVTGIIAALLVGAGLGSLGNDTAAVADVEPEIVTETVVETETLEVTPAACVEALDSAERITHDSTLPAFNAMSDAMLAAAAFDAAGIEEATVTIESLTADLGVLIDDYNAASLACRLLAEG